MHIDINVFYQLTPVEYSWALQDYAENQKNHIEIEQRMGYEVARYMLGHLYNISGKSLKRNIKDFSTSFPLPWDESREVKVQTPDQMANALRSIARAYKK